MATDEHLSVTEAADFLGCDPSTIRRWIAKEKLPARLSGGVWIIRRSDLEELAA